MSGRAIKALTLVAVFSLPRSARADEYVPPESTFTHYLNERNSTQREEPGWQTGIGALVCVGGAAAIVTGVMHALFDTVPKADKAESAYDSYTSSASGLGWADYEDRRAEARLSVGISGLVVGAGLVALGIGIAVIVDAPARERTVNDFPPPWKGRPAAVKDVSRSRAVGTFTLAPTLGGAGFHATF